MHSSDATVAHAQHHPKLAHHFDNLEQQKEASTLGMWVFLVTEIMFFGGMFTAYLVYRHRYFDAFAAGSNTLDLWAGAINTAILIGSSLTVVLAVYAAQMGRRRSQIIWLVLTMVLGAAFLGIKAYEYAHKFEENHVPGPSFRIDPGDEHFKGVDPQRAQLYFSLYFAMTGMHALHMVIGLGVFTWLTWNAYKGRYTVEYHSPVEIGGLYWHFVDIVWIFLFPLLYLISRHG